MTESKWANRWIWASIINGLFATIWTLYFFGPMQPTPSPSRVIAGGSAGTWLFVGYISYIVVGVLATAITALFYYYIEVTLNKPFSGITNVFAWLHLILGNIGVIGATWLMMIAGFQGGAALLPKSVGGGGLTVAQVHEQILAPYPYMIEPFILMVAAGALLGGLAYVINWKRKS
jgi:hypothetical protein